MHGAAVVAGAVGLAVSMGACGVGAEQETRYLAAVQSIGMSDDTALQAGEDACEGKSVDWALPPSSIAITGATSQSLADGYADIGAASIRLAAEQYLC